MTFDLDLERRNIRQLKARHRLSWEAWGQAFASPDERGEIRAEVLGCPVQHCRKSLARIVRADLGWVFCSRIEWLPGDQLRIPPWTLEGMYRQLDPDSPDEELASHLAYLRSDLRSERAPPDGPRWLKSVPPSGVGDLLEFPGGALPGLWLRCRRHPHVGGRVDRQQAIRALHTARGSVHLEELTQILRDA